MQLILKTKIFCQNVFLVYAPNFLMPKQWLIFKWCKYTMYLLKQIFLTTVILLVVYFCSIISSVFCFVHVVHTQYERKMLRCLPKV